ncbi:MAG TPA: hypothetical protein VKY81_03095 [Natronosporangium sp.]|nr:hypothetical protein [Natronosporangium sp.]
MAAATVLAVGAVAWLHVVSGGGGPFAGHVPYLGLDALLAVPFAGAAWWAADRLRARLGLGSAAAVRAGAVAVVFTLLFAPLAVVQSMGHAVLGGAAGHQHHAAVDAAGMAGYAVSSSLRVWPAVLVSALVAVFVARLVAERSFRRQVWARVLGWRRPGVAVSGAAALVAGVAAAAVLPPSPAVAASGSCDSAPKRTYDVLAIDVTVTINRHGDNDPYGYMYVLADNLDELRAEEAANAKASATADVVDENGNVVTPWTELVAADPEARLVSPGLRKDLIQPLVLRARLGECVVINLTNQITRAPVTGPARRLFQVPGGVPSVSIDMQGVAYDAAGGEGGQQVGNSGGNAMAAPGQTVQYRFYLDPAMGEGTKVFRSGGESTQLTAHGLFGALIAEPPDARWYDPETGQEKTNDPSWSNWEAMIQTSTKPTFREFAILYHEIGDSDYTLRRPLRENFAGGAGSPQVDPFDTSADPRLIGGGLPMVDRRAPDQDRAFFRGGGTTSYRPGGRAINYRSESFFRRLQHESALVFNQGGTSAEAAQEQLENKSLGYSSYTYGDPATPMPRSYLGEPSVTRLAHVGFEQLHVHHLHGGGIRWRQNPDADDTDMDGGLRKVPIQNAQSIRLDSQTVSPEESFTLEHECGAGGCQQAAGDFLYHCHVATHYIAGMFGFWRVFDTAQPDLAPLPGTSKPPAAVTSQELLGTTLAAPDGRTVVLDSQVTDPDTEVGLETLVESQLPPQGVRLDKHDATVWDWVKSGPPQAPLYMGEPDYGDTGNNELRSWENYRSDTPGQRHPILFNPKNGRPAFPMLQPHLGYRPPFSPNEHSGAPWLGETGSAERPDGLCPADAPVRTYHVTAISVDIQVTDRELDQGGMIFVLNEDKEAVLSGAKAPEPLTIRSNVGDCVAVTLTNEIDNAERSSLGLKEMAKTNMHTHFVQFDPLASDGVITGLSFEQSVYTSQRENRELVSVDAPDTVTVTQVDRLRPGIAIAVGAGTPNIEIRTIESIDPATNRITFDRALDNSHQAGVPVSVEFVQYRWFSDVDSGTVFWHDHVDGIMSWAHGLFGAHIIEPPGSTYHDPVTGQEVRSGTIVDIHAPSSASVGVGQSGSFREFMIFLHNGRPFDQAPSDFIFGQDCEEGTINLRAAPLGERTPEGTIITNDDGQPIDVNPATTQQRFQFNGFDADDGCRNAFDRNTPARTDDGTVAATVTTVDPYVFSSVKYGDPRTPLLRAYVGDDVVIRTIGTNERAEALRFQGHRFRVERFSNNARLVDAAVTGISERYDYILDGGAGGPRGMPGDYLYYSTRQFALESGAWGIFRVYDKRKSDLKQLPDNSVPTGSGFPKLSPATGDTQTNPGPNPPNATTSNVTGPTNPCPFLAPLRTYDVTVFNHPLPTEPFPDTQGIVYALSVDYPLVKAGIKQVEPLVLRVNRGDCVRIILRNKIESSALYGGTRAGFSAGMLSYNPQLDGGVAIGLNPDSSVLRNQSRTYLFYADKEVGTTIFTNLASPASLRHGAYGMLIVEPQGSLWLDSFTGLPLTSLNTAVQAAIFPPGRPAFREFALTLHSTDQHFSRSVIPYMQVVAGSGINPQRDAGGQPPLRPAPVAGAPPGTRDNPGSFDKGFTHVNYRSEPLTARIGLTDAPGHVDLDGDGVNEPGWFDPGFQVDAPFHSALSSTVHGDPATPVLLTHAGDPVVFRVAVPASDQFHSFVVSGHTFPLEPNMTGSQAMVSRTVTAGLTLDAWLNGGAGGTAAYTGDYAYRDSRQPFTGAGLWGIFRVLPLPGAHGVSSSDTQSEVDIIRIQ